MTARGSTPHHERQERLREERWALLDHFICLTRPVMTVLSFVWVGLITLALVSGLPLILQWLSTAIWALFVADFVAQIVIAPHKVTYLRRHWLTALSLALPAFSMLRILRALQIVRIAAVSGSFSLLQVISACNRGMEATRRVLGQRKLGYVATLTILVTFAGAAGMFSFENPHALRAEGFGSAVQRGAGLHNYGEALWWTAMVMTTMGSAYWPLTLAGRILCWLLALYAFAIFGYITATIASYFLGGSGTTGDQQGQEDKVPDLSAIGNDVAAMREQLTALAARLETQELPGNLVREVRPSRSTRREVTGREATPSEPPAQVEDEGVRR